MIYFCEDKDSMKRVLKYFVYNIYSYFINLEKILTFIIIDLVKGIFLFIYLSLVKDKNYS